MTNNSQKEETFLQSYDAHADALMAFCFERTLDRQRAKECMQQAYATTWQHVAEGAEIQDLEIHLYNVATTIMAKQPKSKWLSLFLKLK